MNKITQNMKIDMTEVGRKLIETVDAGLVKGLGEPVPGKMCVEAALCFALGLPHGDDPGECVGAAVRSAGMNLNDSSWSTDAARASGLRNLAIAQIGSDTIDQIDFAKRVALKTIQRIVPIALREAAKANPKLADDLLKHALNCEGSKDLSSATCAADAAACAASRAAAITADYAAARAATVARAAAIAAGAAADAATEYAARQLCHAANTAAGDEVLTLFANLVIEVLIELQSPGCDWLWLCEEITPNLTKSTKSRK